VHANARQSTPMHASALQSTQMHANARQSMPLHASASAVMCVFLKLFVHELLYKIIDSIDLKWCIGH
jgi:hypothetical protein